MIRGSYAFFDHETGELLGEGTNLLTTAGKSLVASYLAGIAPAWAGAISMGVGTQVADVIDTKLQMEFYRGEVVGSAVNFGGGVNGMHRLIFKCEVDQILAGIIHEIGVYPDMINDAAGVAQSTLVSFGDSTENWLELDTGVWDDIASTPTTTYTRIGEDSVTFESSSTKSYRFAGVTSNFSNYSSRDLFTFAMIKDGNAPTTLAIRFNTDDSNYYTLSADPGEVLAANGEYQVFSYTKSSWVAVGNPSWGDISSIQFDITSGAGCKFYLDGIRVEDVDTKNPDFVLVSRSVLETPVTKISGRQMDVEYYIDVAIFNPGDTIDI